MERASVGAGPLMQNIPPPPPGFVLEGQANSAPPPPRQAQPSQPRGLRNNNPGNIEDGPFARSIPGYAGSDGRFARFDNPEAGTQAKVQLLGSYINRGYDTPLEIINRWAPPSDNNPTQDYAAFVAQRAGIGLNDRVTPDMVPQIAQAIAEFENGTARPMQPQRPMQEPPPPPEGFQIEGGDMQGKALGAPGSSRQNPIDLSQLTNETSQALRKGAWVTNPQTGETWALPGDAWFGNPDESSDRVGSNAFIDRPDIGDTALAASTAFLEQIPFADEAVAAGAGALSGRGYDAVREQWKTEAELLNQTNRGARNVGGVAGFAAGLVAPGGQWVQGAQGVNRIGRAAALGAGYGGLYGAGNTDGNIEDRLASGVRGAGLGAATGGLFQAGADRLGRVAETAAPSAARRLSREGVSLTPGQMASDIPILGPMLRGAEDTVSSIPFLGSAVQGARNQGVESFNRAAINRSLSPIGQSLPRDLNAGYDAVQYAQQTLGRAYDDVLPRVSAQLDQPLYDEIAGVLNNATAEMPEPMVRQLGAIIQNRVLRNVDQADARITGEQFKRIESELSALSRDYVRANDPAAKSLGLAIEDVRGAMRNLIARQNPAEAQRIQDINRGYANLTRVEKAAGSSASLATEGVFTPTQLGQAVTQMGGSRSQGGAGGRLMQDLASAAKSVLPNTVGDSGTAARGAMTALVGGAATGTVAPGLAIPVVAASLAYSKPAQMALNALYRSTDRPGASAELAKLAALAAKNPALVPYYEQALLRVQLGFPNSRQEQAPAARGLFGASRPQMATQ